MIMHGVGYGMGIWGILIMVLFWGLLIAGIAWLVKTAVVSGGGAGSNGGNAVDILERRFARGEITREEFKQMKKDLQS